MVVANGAEGEPGSIKDRAVLRARPEHVLAGLALAARTLGAREAVVYLEGRFAAEEAALLAALDASPPDLPVRVVRGAEGYVGGEETAVLEALEGRRAWPRPKPPLPAAVGLNGRPTLVQNVETLSRVVAAVDAGPDFASDETTAVSVWGHVRRPGAYEVPLGTPLRELVDAWAGGAHSGVSWVFPAGPSAPPLHADRLDLPLHPDRLREAGSGLGTAAVLVMPEGACPVALARSAAAFFARESCGQCPPCVLGTSRLAAILGAVEGGGAHARELSALREAAAFMAMHGYCAHGRTAASTVTGFLSAVSAHVQAHLDAGRCPEGQAYDPFADGSPERVAIEAALEASGVLRTEPAV